MGRSERLERGDAPRVSDELRRGGAVRGVPEEDPGVHPARRRAAVGAVRDARHPLAVADARAVQRPPRARLRSRPRGFRRRASGVARGPRGDLELVRGVVGPADDEAARVRGGTRRGRERAIADANRLARGRHRARVPGAGDARGGARRSRRAGGRRGFARRGDDGIREDARRTVVVHPKSAETLVHQGEVRVVREVRRRGGVARERGRGAAAREVGASGEPRGRARGSANERRGGGGATETRRAGTRRARAARTATACAPRVRGLARLAPARTRRLQPRESGARVVHRARPARRARAARPRLKIRFEPRRAFFRCSPDAARKVVAVHCLRRRRRRLGSIAFFSRVTTRLSLPARAGGGVPRCARSPRPGRPLSASRTAPCPRRGAARRPGSSSDAGARERRCGAPPSPTPVPVTALTFSPFPSTPPSRRRRGACSTASPRASPA